MAHRMRRPQGRTPTRRGTNWSRVISTSPDVVPASSKVLLTTFVLSNPGITETIVRTIGRYFVASDQALALEEQLGAWGMVRVTEAAAAIGITAIPGSVTDKDDEGWMVWEGIAQNGQLTTGGPSGFTY